MQTILETKDLKAYYITHAYGVQRTVKAVDGVSLSVRENEVYGIAGESGCGKSTLLKVLLGMITPPLTVVDGSVFYGAKGDKRDIVHMPEAELRSMRWKEMSYLPQGSMSVLNPVRRIRDTFRDFIGAHTAMSTRKMDSMVHDYLQDLGLPDKVINSFPHQLSGGMRQRVTIALSTILAPDLILTDEPTTALDVVVQRGVIQLLEEIRERYYSTIVMVTHDMGVHANFSERIGVLYAGKLIEEAATPVIFKAPRHPYTQYLIRSLPTLDDKSRRLSIPGRPPALDDLPTGCSFHPRCPHASEGCRDEFPSLVEVEPGHRVACFRATRG
ncbi:MAG: ABC transporter ATP-binding protein [Anaerolineae bacterium]